MKKLKVAICLISSILTLTCGKYAKAETTLLPTLSITLSKKQFLIGEPFIVILKLANESSEPLPRVFSSNEDFATADFTFTVTTTDGSKICEVHIQGADIIRLVFNLLRPQEFWQCEQMFLPRISLEKKVQWDPNSPIPLLSSGLYKLTAKLLWNPPEEKSVFITSNSVDFQINEPTGIDAEASKLIQSPEVSGFFEGTRGGKPKAITTLLANYPESTYATYARARLILDQGKHIWNTSRTAPTASKKEELALLISNGLDYVEKNKDMLLNDNILLYCARMSRVLDREKESVQILKRLVKDFPQSDATEAGQRQLEKWDRPIKPGEEPASPAVTEMPVVAYTLIAVTVGIVIAGLILLLKKKASNPHK